MTRKIGYGLIECDKYLSLSTNRRTCAWRLSIERTKKFQYLDSLKDMDTQVLEVLARYYVDEIKDKSAQDIDVSSWEHEYVHDLLEQENGFDCGMFFLKYTDFYSRGLTLFFWAETYALLPENRQGDLEVESRMKNMMSS